MKKTIVQDYCCFCGQSGVVLLKHSLRKNKFKADVQKMQCRPCNTNRVRKYTTTETGKKSAYASYLRQTKKSPEKYRARHMVSLALKSGLLKKEPCFCGSKEVHAHHDDYSEPLKVLWLCTGHHADRHRFLKSGYTPYKDKTI